MGGFVNIYLNSNRIYVRTINNNGPISGRDAIHGQGKTPKPKPRTSHIELGSEEESPSQPNGWYRGTARVHILAQYSKTKKK